MKKNIYLKNFLSAIIISILLLNSSGYILLYFSSTHFVKKYVIKKLLNSELDKEIILLSISKKDIEENKVSFKWIHSREFRFNGKMYDIKKNLSDADSLRFLCYYDDKENLLEELFHNFSKSENENHKQRNSINILAFIGLFLEKNKEFETFFTSTNLSLVLIENPIQQNSEVLTPPPQVLLG